MRRRHMVWEVVDDYANVLAHTASARERDEWLAELKHGEWGDNVAMYAVNVKGLTVERLWPSSSAFPRKDNDD